MSIFGDRFETTDFVRTSRIIWALSYQTGTVCEMSFVSNCVGMSEQNAVLLCRCACVSVDRMYKLSVRFIDRFFGFGSKGWGRRDIGRTRVIHSVRCRHMQEDEERVGRGREVWVLNQQDGCVRGVGVDSAEFRNSWRVSVYTGRQTKKKKLKDNRSR